tara:strand:+ start:363 stop:506 length:144 start_codon:yes stop_codon:yes gene_type:complete
MSEENSVPESPYSRSEIEKLREKLKDQEGAEKWLKMIDEYLNLKNEE